MTIKITSFTKVLALSLVLCLTSSIASAQLIQAKATPKAHLSPYGKVETNWYKIGWFADINGGTRLLGAVSDAASLGAGLNVNAGVGFFITDKIGIKGRMDYNRFSFTPNTVLNTYEARGGAMSFSLEATTDLLPFTSGSKIRDWRIELHGGFGYTSFANRALKEYGRDIDEDYFAEDPAIKGNDDMGHMILGLTPQYHISGRWSINLDFSSFFLFKQDFTFDNYNGKRFDGIGNISALSLGVTFRP